MKSLEDIIEALDRLTTVELLRLELYAEWLIRGLGRRKARGRDAKDLLGEAMVGTVVGDRVWNDRVDLCTHLLGAMRSIVSCWRGRRGEEYLESELARPEVESPLDRVVTTLDPERVLRAKQTLEQVERLFAEDVEALRVIRLLGLGCAAKEIQVQLRMSPHEFAAAAKRIRRKLEAEFPEVYRARRLKSSSRAKFQEGRELKAV